MKQFILIIIALTCSFTLLARSNREIDSLKMLQGVWNFEGLIIQLDVNYHESYYATDLHIKGDHFQMNLSEAAACGTIKKWKTELAFVFTCETSNHEDTVTNDWKNMEIFKLEKKRIELMMRNVDLAYFSNELKGIANVVFIYARKKRKSKLFGKEYSI